MLFDFLGHSKKSRKDDFVYSGDVLAASYKFLVLDSRRDLVPDFSYYVNRVYLNRLRVFFELCSFTFQIRTEAFGGFLVYNTFLKKYYLRSYVSSPFFDDLAVGTRLLRRFYAGLVSKFPPTYEYLLNMKYFTHDDFSFVKLGEVSLRLLVPRVLTASYLSKWNKRLVCYDFIYHVFGKYNFIFFGRGSQSHSSAVYSDEYRCDLSRAMFGFTPLVPVTIDRFSPAAAPSDIGFLGHLAYLSSSMYQLGFDAFFEDRYYYKIGRRLLVLGLFLQNHFRLFNFLLSENVGMDALVDIRMKWICDKETFILLFFCNLVSYLQRLFILWGKFRKIYRTIRNTQIKFFSTLVFAFFLLFQKRLFSLFFKIQEYFYKLLVQVYLNHFKRLCFFYAYRPLSVFFSNKLLKMCSVSSSIFFVSVRETQALTAGLFGIYSRYLIQHKFPYLSVMRAFLGIFGRVNYFLGFYSRGNGRFSRRQRASHQRFNVGSVMRSLRTSMLFYTFVKVITRYGMCGVHFWINYDSAYISFRFRTGSVYKC